MQFFKGLNEPFSQVRGQILMMDPIPSIKKVFSLVVQEERQRFISPNIVAYNVDQNNPTVMATNFAYKSVKDIPKCTHCGTLSQAMNKCYKVTRLLSKD